MSAGTRSSVLVLVLLGGCTAPGRAPVHFGAGALDAAPPAAVGAPDPARRFAAVVAGLAARPGDRTAWRTQLRSPDSVARAWAVFVLSRTGEFDPLPLLSDPDSEVRYRAAEALGRSVILDAAAGALLRERLRDPDPFVRVAAAWALLHGAGPERDGLQVLVESLGREAEAPVVREAARRLADLYGAPPEPCDPSLGYARQDASRAVWLASLAERLPTGVVPAAPGSGPAPAEAFTLEDTLEALGEGDPPAEVRPLWSLAVGGSSRHPRLLEARARLLERLVRRQWSEGLLHADTALALLHAGRLADARHHYALAIRIHPDVPGLLNDYARLLEGLGAFQEAEDIYRRAAEGAPEDALPLLDLGHLLAGQGRTAEAAQTLILGESREPARWGYHRIGLGALLDAESAP